MVCVISPRAAREEGESAGTPHFYNAMEQMDGECPICLEEKTHFQSFLCHATHRICSDCLIHFLKGKDKMKCPLCYQTTYHPRFFFSCKIPSIDDKRTIDLILSPLNKEGHPVTYQNLCESYASYLVNKTEHVIITFLEKKVKDNDRLIDIFNLNMIHLCTVQHREFYLTILYDPDSFPYSGSFRKVEEFCLDRGSSLESCYDDLWFHSFGPSRTGYDSDKKVEWKLILMEKGKILPYKANLSMQSYFGKNKGSVTAHASAHVWKALIPL